MRSNIYILLIVVGFIVSCTTVQRAEIREEAPASRVSLEELAFLYRSANDAINAAKYTEGIYHLVTILGKTEGRRLPEAEAWRAKALDELRRIENAMSLEAAQEWLDASGKQTTAETGLVREDAVRSPAVLLAVNFGNGKVVVSDAPIEFSFSKESGKIGSIGTTNAYGVASVPILSFDDPGIESVVKARVVFTAAGHRYSMDSIVREFVFLPPPAIATILVLERSPKGFSENSVLGEELYDVLKELPVTFRTFNKRLLEEAFVQLQNGDQRVLAEIGFQTEAMYAVSVFSDTGEAEQVKFGNRTYNIFKAQNTTAIKIFRIRDGKLLYAKNLYNIYGQGNAEDAAVSDSFIKAGETVKTEMRKDLKPIGTAFSGGR
jgi:hypothetical protein